MMRGQASCCVCRVQDDRALSKTELANGQEVTICGTHKLIHDRAARKARNLDDLRNMVGEKRAVRERRSVVQGDELGMLLSDAFTSNKRASSDRRR